MNHHGASNPEQVPEAFRRPAWDDWKSKDCVRLWQAVALACEIDPSQFTIFEDPGLTRFFTPPPKSFEDLLIMAKGSIGAGGILKLVSKSAEGLEESEIRLSTFTTWLKSIGHQPPIEFPWQPEIITFSNMNWPWGRHETDLLRKLAAAAHRFWNNYEPNDSTTAPTNKQVIDWLKEQGVSERTAEAMATILRADGLLPGPRK